MTGKRRISRQERRRKKRLRQRMTTGLMAAGAVLLIASAWLLWSQGNGLAGSIEYQPEDIAKDQPLHAVHEMGASAPITFLPKSQPQPAIKVDSRFYDFGTIGANDVVTHDFVIANTGQSPLTISRAYTTCGCTTADFTSAIIPPGEVSIMTIRLDAGFHDVRGQTVRRGVIIENNDPDNSEVEVWIQATVR